jgi:hypothetical protein
MQRKLLLIKVFLPASQRIDDIDNDKETSAPMAIDIPRLETD